MTETTEITEVINPTNDVEEFNVTRNLATDIISAFVANNPTTAEALPNIIRTVYAEVSGWGKEAPRVASFAAAAETSDPEHQSAPPARAEPAVPIKKSVTPDYIFCLEDGKRFKSLKRHLDAVYNMSPDDYRKRWGLPADYPMVAPNYARQRSELAKSMGLGRNAATNRRRRATPVGAEVAAV